MTVNIGGDDIQTATIDGEQVREITIDGELAYWYEGFSDGTLGHFSAYGEGNGNITVSGGELTIEQTVGGGSNANIIGVYSNDTFNVGDTLEVRSKNTSGRHAAIIGLSLAQGDQAFPHGGGGSAACVLYSRADAVTANTSVEDESGNTSTDSPPIQDYRNYRTLRMERPDGSTVEIYADGNLQTTFTGLDFDQDYHIYFAADGFDTPNTIVVDYAKMIV